jgi:molybdopterin-containing oxidoreductase family iron-sulfur binding subunit
MNERLGNSGETVWYSERIGVAPTMDQTLDVLVADMAAGAVDTLIILDSNPAYTAAGALDFKASLKRVPTCLHAGLHVDETAALCQWHLPLSHPLESWTDARAIDGSAVIVQPVIRPLYASRSIHQIVDTIAGALDPAADAAMHTTWRQTFGNDFDRRWRAALHDGFVAGSAAQPFA